VAAAQAAATDEVVVMVVVKTVQEHANSASPVGAADTTVRREARIPAADTDFILARFLERL
jgi:hypothetical protein